MHGIKNTSRKLVSKKFSISQQNMQQSYFSTKINISKQIWPKCTITVLNILYYKHTLRLRFPALYTVLSNKLRNFPYFSSDYRTHPYNNCWCALCMAVMALIVDPVESIQVEWHMLSLLLKMLRGYCTPGPYF